MTSPYGSSSTARESPDDDGNRSCDSMLARSREFLADAVLPAVGVDAPHADHFTSMSSGFMKRSTDGFHRLLAIPRSR